MTPSAGTEEFLGGRRTALEIGGNPGCLIEPVGNVDTDRRWIWFSPGWMCCRVSPTKEWPGHYAEHEFFVEKILARGFHVVGVECYLSCGSPRTIEVYEKTYEEMTRKYGLNPKARMLCQSNGGLMVYNWAVRHPEAVDRILGFCPATDLRSWPGLEKACDPEFTHGNGYDMSPAELEARLGEFNPVEQLEPLAAAGVPILHLHGDEDTTVPLEPNSAEFCRRYRHFGGEMELVVMRGIAHKPRRRVWYRLESPMAFLLE